MTEHRVSNVTLFMTYLSLLIPTPLVTSAGNETCYSTDNNPYLYFGTKTTYDAVRNPQGIPKVPGCRPLQVWMVGRHGAHWTKPTENPRFVRMLDLRDEILRNHERGRGSLCQEDLALLRDWREYLVSSREQDSLTPQGVRDTYVLGLGVRQALPELFDDADMTRDFVFYHTDLDKTRQTAEYFAKGLFGIIYNPKFPDGLEKSDLLQDFEDCPAWVQKNAKIGERVDRFVRGPAVQEVRRTVSRRLGFNYDLPFYAVHAMYQWCARERAVALEGPAAWCSAFTASELKVIEYLDDIQFYFKTGPGDRTGMNKKLGCPLVADMLARFRKIEMDPDNHQPKGVFYFGEAEIVGLVASKLGLFGDRRPISNSYVKGRRTFRTSALLPWDANIMAVFFQCSSGERHRVMFLVSQYVVPLPGCPSGLCPWSLVRHRLGHPTARRGCSLQFCTRLQHSWLPFTTLELWCIIAVVSTVMFIIHLFRAINTLTGAV